MAEEPQKTPSDRIDLRIMRDGTQYLTCPHWPDLRGKVPRYNGTDATSLYYAIGRFRAKLNALVGESKTAMKRK